MNKFSGSNLAFIDLLFILLIGFTLMLIAAVLHINPIAQEGKIDPVAKIIITLRWPNESVADIDLWVRGPDGKSVGYARKDGKYIILDRDDLGRGNDIYIVNGERKVVKKNMEMMTINDLPDGEYVVNLHNYSFNFADPFGSRREEEEEYPIPTEVEVVQMTPYKVLWTGKAKLIYRQEVTLITFKVTDGVVHDIRDDVDIPLFYTGGNAFTRPSPPARNVP
jgi:hypothetical protein